MPQTHPQVTKYLNWWWQTHLFWKSLSDMLFALQLKNVIFSKEIHWEVKTFYAKYSFSVCVCECLCVSVCVPEVELRDSFPQILPTLILRQSQIGLEVTEKCKLQAAGQGLPRTYLPSVLALDLLSYSTFLQGFLGSNVGLPAYTASIYQLNYLPRTIS